MSDEDNIIEIDFDEEQLATEVDDVSLPAMDKSNSPTLHVGILGNNEISNSLEVCLGHPYKYSPITFTKYNDVDSCISDQNNHIVYICLDVLINDDLSVDDAAVVDACNKVAQHTPCAIILKSTIPLETLTKIVQNVQGDRFVYSPELTTNDSMEQILNSKIEFIGGTEKSISDYKNLMERHSLFDRELITGSPFDIAVLKMVISTHKAVFQTYWNQIEDYCKDSIANFNVVKKLFNKNRDNFVETIPTYLKAKAEGKYTYKKAKSFGGEYLNKEVILFSESTDKLPILDDCINKKNLKD